MHSRQTEHVPPDSEDGAIERIVTEITAFLDRLIRAGKITRKDKRILLETLHQGEVPQGYRITTRLRPPEAPAAAGHGAHKKTFLQVADFIWEQRFFRPWSNFF